MKHAALFISLLLVLNAHAQKDKFILKWSPLSLVDINFPTMQAGIESRLSARISWYNEFGINFFNYAVHVDTGFLSPNGFKAKTELRYYFRNNNKKSRPVALSDVYYFAVNAFYVKDVHNLAIRYYYNNDSSQHRNDNFGVKKTVFGVNLIFGFQEAISKKFLFDIYGGPGIRFRHVINVNKEFVFGRDFIPSRGDYNFNQGTIETEAKGGFSVAPNVSLGIRLCYRL